MYRHIYMRKRGNIQVNIVLNNLSNMLQFYSGGEIDKKRDEYLIVTQSRKQYTNI